MIVLYEHIDLERGHDRYRFHQIIDNLFYIMTADIDGKLEVIPEYELDLDELQFNHDLEIHDFDLKDVTIEELEEEKRQLHLLISDEDVTGLQDYTGAFPLDIELAENASMNKLLNSGVVESAVYEHIFFKYDNYDVEHSSSATNSNSFYIVNEDGEKVLKISDHNTNIQKSLHGTEFINVYKYKKVSEIIEAIDNYLTSL